jgi:hypothetical protein
VGEGLVSALRVRDPSGWTWAAIGAIAVLGAALVAVLGYLVPVLP